MRSMRSIAGWRGGHLSQRVGQEESRAEHDGELLGVQLEEVLTIEPKTTTTELRLVRAGKAASEIRFAPGAVC